MNQSILNGIQRLLFAAGTSSPATLARAASRFIHRPCAYVGDDTIFAQTVFGHLMFFDARDTSLLPSLVTRGYWEPGVTRALLRIVRPGQHIVEVGANVGYYSILIASSVTSTGSVTAFEANPRAVDLLRRTLTTNGYARTVRVVPLAVTDRPGRVTLYRLEREQASSSLYAFAPQQLAVRIDTASPLEVEATSLDAFFGGDGRPPDLVKIDAEGAEPAIVAGMQGLLARAPDLQIVLEFLPSAIKRAGTDPRDFLQSLVRLGFQIINLRGRFRPATIDHLLALNVAELYLRR